MLNNVVLIGRLAKDPELKYTPKGTAVTTFNLAVDRIGKDAGADFIPIVVFKQTAEAAANHLKKGHKCAIEGRIQVRNYDNNEGRKVYVTEVIAHNVRFLESAKRENSQQSSNHPNGQDPFAGAGNGKPIDISDDDLPF